MLKPNGNLERKNNTE